jgi:hypothetical protein
MGLKVHQERLIPKSNGGRENQSFNINVLKKYESHMLPFLVDVILDVA